MKTLFLLFRVYKRKPSMKFYEWFLLLHPIGAATVFCLRKGIIRKQAHLK